MLREGRHTISSFFKMVNDDEINEKCNELFELYAKEFKLTNDEYTMFNGVHLNLIPALEHLFGYRIDVYTLAADDNDKIKFDIAAKAQSRYVYTSSKKPMTLLLYDSHYYLLLDKDRVINGRYASFGCGKSFSASNNLLKHTRSRCVKNESLKKYASGSVESSKLLLVKIKETFDVPDDILPPLIYDDDSPEQELLHPKANDIYFTKKFATFDFESKLQKTTIDDIKKSQLEYIREQYDDDEDVVGAFEFAEEMESDLIRQTLDEEMVYSDEGELITGRRFREMYGDEEYILKNVAVSYSIAHNFAHEILQDERFAHEIEEYNYVEEDRRSDKCSINRRTGCVKFSRSNANSKGLIESFYNDLKEVGKHYRIQNHIRYASLVDYLTSWFERRKIKLNIIPPDSNEQMDLDIFDDDNELMNGNPNINMNNDAIATPIITQISYVERLRAEASAARMCLHPEQQQQQQRVDLNEVDGKSLIESMPLELRLMDEFKRFLEMPVILGYNSGKYDIPLIKKELYHQIFVKDAHPTDSRHLHIIRKGPSCYTSIQLTDMSLSASGGCYGFLLKDMREFTGPGGNLKTFMKAFQEPTTTTTRQQDDDDDDDDDDDGKFYFPYEWLERYEQLKETQLPPYECFFSSLKDMNVLEEDMFLYKKKKNILHLSDCCQIIIKLC